MRHLVSGRKLGRTRSHRQAMLGNLATSLIIHDSKSIRTTLARAKELRPFVEKLITRAKIAFNKERNGHFQDGHVDVHARREVAKIIRDKKALQALFDDIAPSVLERNGGYTRIVKLGQRRGDGAEEAIIQLVDWAAKQDGVISLNDRKRKPAARKSAPKAAATVAKAATADVVADTVAEEPVVAEEVVDTVEETVDTVDTAVDNAADAPSEAADSTSDADSAE